MSLPETVGHCFILLLGAIFLSRDKSKRKKRVSKPRERELAEESAPLDEFVDRHHAEGSYDSTGQFTICQEKAERKLGKFQLEDDEDWILLLAQAANRSGATMMHVHLGLRTVDVTLKGPWKWEWARLRSAMKEKPTSDRALVSLAAAIRVLCTMYAFTVSPPGGEPQKWDHKSFTAVPKQGAAEETRISLHCGDWYTGLGQIFSEHRVEALREKLESRCRLGGTYLSLYCEGRAKSSATVSSITPRTLDVASVPIFVGALKKPTVHEGFRFLLRAKPAELPEPQAVQALLHVCLAWDPKEGVVLKPGHSEIFWLLDGVVVHHDHLPLEGSLGLSLVVSAAGLKTDVSGLRLVNSPEFSHRRELLRKSLVSRLEPLASPAEGPSVKVCSQAGTLGAATLGFVGTALGARFFPPALWFTVPLGLYWAARSHQRAKTLAGELERTLSKELKTLPERVDSALHNDVWSPTKWIHHASIRDKDYGFL